MSDDLSGPELGQRLGVQGDRVRTRGESTQTGQLSVVSRVNVWELGSLLSPTTVVEAHLLDLYTRVAPLADPLRGLAQAGCTLMLRIVQYMDPQEEQGYGIPIGKEWLELLSHVGASIDIDQYVEA